jgi:heme-degrading monooxygenase HmoA
MTATRVAFTVRSVARSGFIYFRLIPPTTSCNSSGVSPGDAANSDYGRAETCPCYDAAVRSEADREGGNMFTSIRKYNVRPGSAGELARRVQEGFVPLVRQMVGFRSYYLLDGGPDVLITISRFDSADEAFASNEKAANWVRNNVLEFTKGMPEVMNGHTLIAEVKPP